MKEGRERQMCENCSKEDITIGQTIIAFRELRILNWSKSTSNYKNIPS